MRCMQTKKPKRQSDRALLSQVTKEMARVRFAESARGANLGKTAVKTAQRATPRMKTAKAKALETAFVLRDYPAPRQGSALSIV